jgi:hypothetical protein
MSVSEAWASYTPRLRLPNTSAAERLFMKISAVLKWAVMGLALVVMCSVVQAGPLSAGDPPLVIPTFHCLGLYWSPAAGCREKEVQVRYRVQDTAEWNEGLPMRYNPIPGTDEDLADYRGSIVHLTPNTIYEVRLTLAGTSTSATIRARTWNEVFPVGETVRVGNRSQTLEITESGTPEAYRVYDGQGAVIDVHHEQNASITVNASYVILRNFTLKGAGVTKRIGKGPCGAISLLGGHDIVIEDCDISDWGSLNSKTGFGSNMDSGILARQRSLARLIVQRCKIHHPACDGSTWYEPTFPTHTAGPQCISLFDTDGNHVIRYNECWSDLDHMFNDVIGGGSNGSFRGAPGPDSDVYGNLVSYCWDDGLEIEGGNRNTRVWGNYITQSMNMIGNAPTSIGPLYIWRNVVGRSQSKPDHRGLNFLKMGYATSEDWMTGHQYIFHNTMFDEDGWLPTGGLGGSRIVKHTTTRNNILQVRLGEGWSVGENKANIDNDFDYDLCNGRIAAGAEAHAVRGVPVYVLNASYDSATKTGRFQLTDDSPGAGAAVAIPNFSDVPAGSHPDMGAHQRGTPAMRFGVNAGR